MADVLDADHHNDAAIAVDRDDQPASSLLDIDHQAASIEEEEFSLSLKKKKKKKSKKSSTLDDEDSTSLASTTDGSISSSTASTSSANASTAAGGVPSTTSDGIPIDEYTYTDLLERVYSLLQELNPNLTTRKRHVMPPPQLARIGTRKTMWSNFAAAAQVMRRNLEHLMAFVLSELGTEGSIDGSNRLVIKGRYQSKQIESLLKKYIVEYVTCHMCRNPDTILSRDSVTRLYFLQCESCGSRRSVTPVKTGFHATTRAERRKA
jgi:translation initiation factor 2 subunit 2